MSKIFENISPNRLKATSKIDKEEFEKMKYNIFNLPYDKEIFASDVDENKNHKFSYPKHLEPLKEVIKSTKKDGSGKSYSYRGADRDVFLRYIIYLYSKDSPLHNPQHFQTLQQKKEEALRLAGVDVFIEKVKSPKYDEKYINTLINLSDDEHVKMFVKFLRLQYSLEFIQLLSIEQLFFDVQEEIHIKVTSRNTKDPAKRATALKYRNDLISGLNKTLLERNEILKSMFGDDVVVKARFEEAEPLERKQFLSLADMDEEIDEQ